MRKSMDEMRSEAKARYDAMSIEELRNEIFFLSSEQVTAQEFRNPEAFEIHTMLRMCAAEAYKGREMAV